MIPPFDKGGNLPPGIHEADWDELETRFSDSARRVELLAGLREALVALREASCRTVYIDGSFVTAKEEPGDFDACWEPEGVNLKVSRTFSGDEEQARPRELSRLTWRV